jgi:hypothetical protein
MNKRRKGGLKMRRRSFKVTVLMAKDQSIKSMRLSIGNILTQIIGLESAKVTYLRRSPWWKFWKRS